MACYEVNNYAVETLLTNIKTGEMAIPEMQRPFVWDSTKVRDLMDSLYKGFPVGYIVLWQNPKVKLKDGSTANGKKILIDGQLNIPQQVYRLSEKAVPPFRGKCTAYPPRCTAHSLGYDVKII